MYLPFVETTKHPTMGLKPLAIATWLEIDEHFVADLIRKQALLINHHQAVFASLENTRSPQAAVLQLLVAHLLRHYPDIYQAHDRGICNLKTKQVFNFSDFAAAPLDLAGRLVQEDLCLLEPEENRYILSAASVCFPLRWSLQEKLGQSIAQIHQPVPGYAQKLEQPVDKVFTHLREEFPTRRYNWNLVDTPDLYLPPKPSVVGFDPTITPENAGQRIWLRVEHQTLRCLPKSKAILFTIRTHIDSLDRVTTAPTIAEKLSQAVQALMPETQAYKNLLSFRSALLDYLAARAQV